MLKYLFLYAVFTLRYCVTGQVISILLLRHQNVLTYWFVWACRRIACKFSVPSFDKQVSVFHNDFAC